MTIFAIVTIGPAAPMDFGITMAGAAVGQQRGLLTSTRRLGRKSKAAPILEGPAAMSAARSFFVEASPQGGSIRSMFNLEPAEHGTGLQRFAGQCLDPNMNGSLNWRLAASMLPGGTPFLDCPTNPSESAVLLSNSGVDVFAKLAASPDLAIVDFGELYHGAPTLDCLPFASFVFVVVTPAWPVLTRAAHTVSALASDILASDRLGFVVRGDASTANPDADLIQRVLPGPVTLVVPHDPRASIGSVISNKALESSAAVRKIRTFTRDLLVTNGLTGNPTHDKPTVHTQNPSTPESGYHSPPNSALPTPAPQVDSTERGRPWNPPSPT